MKRLTCWYALALIDGLGTVGLGFITLWAARDDPVVGMSVLVCTVLVGVGAECTYQAFKVAWGIHRARGGGR